MSVCECTPMNVCLQLAIQGVHPQISNLAAFCIMFAFCVYQNKTISLQEVCPLSQISIDGFGTPSVQP